MKRSKRTKRVPISTGADDCSPASAADVPTTVLLGRRWPAVARRSVDRVAKRLAKHLGHAVEACDLDAPGEPLRLIARRAAARGAIHLVLLPLALDDPARRDRRGNDAVTAAVAPWPFLRVHRGGSPAADDVARMLGDHARDAAGTFRGGRRNGGRRDLSDVVVVIAAGDGGNPAANGDVAKLARLVYEAHRFADVTYAFVGVTTPHLSDVIARSARLGARGIAVVPHLLFDPATHRRLVQEAQAAGAAARVEVAVARPLGAHRALSWALMRRHLEALADVTLVPGAGTPWVNPDLLRVLQHAHGHSPGMGTEWQARIAAILPPRYLDPGLTVSSAPMGAAALQRDAEGRVAWDEMWQGFCELGLAGGPPHRGTLLEAVAPDEARADPARYEEVRAELARGLRMVTGRPVVLDGSSGWIGIECVDEEMAIWLMRAIVVENVMVRRERAVLFLPAGPRFTLEGEIKNVVTVAAKTFHYWSQHQAARGFDETGPS